MKRVIRFRILAAILAVAMTGYTGCKKSDGNGDDDGGGDCGAVTLAGIKKAAQDAGYEVSDTYTKGWGETDGFTVVLKRGASDLHKPVLQFKDRAAADACAKKEMDAGWNYPVQNCRFLTFASATGGVVDDEVEKAMLESLMNGKPANN